MVLTACTVYHFEGFVVDKISFAQHLELKMLFFPTSTKPEVKSSVKVLAAFRKGQNTASPYNKVIQK